jgi:hypothetical protein
MTSLTITSGRRTASRAAVVADRFNLESRRQEAPVDSRACRRCRGHENSRRDRRGRRVTHVIRPVRGSHRSALPCRGGNSCISRGFPGTPCSAVRGDADRTRQNSDLSPTALRESCRMNADELASARPISPSYGAPPRSMRGSDRRPARDRQRSRCRASHAKPTCASSPDCRTGLHLEGEQRAFESRLRTIFSTSRDRRARGPERRQSTIS